MASQSDTLNLAASVVDQFSKPLADLTRQLKAFSSLEQTTSQRGKRAVDDHWKSYRELAAQSKVTSENVKKLLTPAIEGLGLSTIIATRSLGSFAAALKGLGEHATNLEFLKTETGLATQKLREYEEAGKRVGISVDQTDAAIKRLAENMNQQKKGKGFFLTNPELLNQPKAVQDFVRSLASMDVAHALEAIRQKLAATKGEEQALYARLLDMPQTMGRESDEIFARVQKNLGNLTSQSESDLAEMNQSWFDLKEAINGASDAIEAKFAPALADAAKWTAEFAKQHPYIALIAGSFASISSSVVQMTAGLIVLKSIFGGRAAAAAAAAPVAAEAGGIGTLGALGLGAAGFGVGLGAYGIRSLTHDEDVEGTGYGAHYTGGRSAGQVTWENFKKWWSGLDLGGEAHAATDPRSGPGAGHRRLMARGTPGGLGTEVRDKEAVSKSVSTGAKEGVLAAFYQWFSDPSHGAGLVGGGGGIGGTGAAGGLGLTTPGGAGAGGGGRSGWAAGGGSPGGGGGGGSPGGQAGKGEYNVRKAYDLLKSQGATDEEAHTLAAISQPESGGNPNITNMRGADNSYGLWQINMKGALGPERLRQFGIKSAEELKDPATNARAALSILRGKGGYSNWSTYSSGAYRRYLGGEGSAGVTPIVDKDGNVTHIPTQAGHSVDIGHVDPRLRDILDRATPSLPPGWHAEVQSGFRKGDPRFHGRGMAEDIQLYDENGKKVGNYQDPKTFEIYERYAQAAKKAQLAKYPELSKKLRWGGYFGGGRGTYGAMDEMHFDLGGEEAGMAGGSWAGGLKNPNFPGAHSKGLDAAAREHSSMNHKVKGEANVNIKLAGFPKGTTHNVKMAGDLFKEVKLNRGRAMSAEA